MKTSLRFILLLFAFSPLMVKSQCTTTNAKTCVCPPGGGTNCDLLPDISIARLPLNQTSNYTEYPQVCNPPCSGNDGRLRIGVSTPIIGYGPLETRGTPTYVCGTDTVTVANVSLIPAACPVTGLPPRQLINQRIYHKIDSVMFYYDRPAGTMTYHPTHGHQHVDNWGIYTLRSNNGDPNPVNWPILGSGTKLGFCLLDIGSCNGSPGYCVDTLGVTMNSSNLPNYGLGGGSYSCSNTVQGISNGYLDTYSQSLDGMWINLPAGLCNGTYWVVIQIDPFNYFLETNENNNVVAVPITLTKQSLPLTITASGPLSFCPGQSVTLSTTSPLPVVWSNGATTQSIVVSSPGTFTVSYTCGSVITSSPVTVSYSAGITASSSANPTASNCNGDPVQLTSSASSGGAQYIPVTFTSNQQVMIPDNNSTGVTSAISVSGISPATLNSSSIVSVKLNLTHTWDSDLAISLISPSGNTIYLSNRNGSSGDNFTNTVFSMSATTAIASGTSPFTGNYIPDGSFTSLTGNVNGTWLLKVQDLAGQDTGRIQNWNIIINQQAPETINYSWLSSPAGFSSSQQNPVLNPTASATYTVTATGATSGCSGSSSVSVTVPPAISLFSFSPSHGAPGTLLSITGNGLSNISSVTIGGIAVSSFTIVNVDLIQAIVPNSPGTSGLVCVKNLNKCSKCSSTNFTIDASTSVLLNLNIYLEGLYLGNGQMNPVLNNNGLNADITACDTILIDLHEATSPYAIAASAKGLLHKNGNASATFSSSILGRSYYLAVRHRNSMETWSKNPVPFNSSPVNFDFTKP